MATGEVLPSVNWGEAAPQPLLTHSCIKLGCSAEPCVNKAVSHLSSLREHLTKERRKGIREKKARPTPSLTNTASIEVTNEQRIETPRRRVRESSGGGLETESLGPMAMSLEGARSSALLRGSDLVVEGVRTGERCPEKGAEQPWREAVAVVSGALDLVGRLDSDRQETLSSLVSEKERVAGLKAALDVERERRMDLLPAAVQTEHEQCLKDVLELKWHISYEGRQLARAQDALRVTTEKNGELQRKVQYLTENCPLLEGKLEVESDHMSQVVHLQQETSDQLHQAQHKLAETEDRSFQAHSHAAAERTKLKQALSEIEEKVGAASDELAAASKQAVAISHQMLAAQKTIAGHRQQSRHYDEKIGQCKVNHSTIKTRVSYLQEDLTRLELEHEKISERNQRLKDKKDAEHATLDSTHSRLLSVLHDEEDRLRKTRDANDEMEQERDTLKEKIAACIKQTGDDAKSVERAKKELVRLDQQLQVSMAQFSQVREENFQLTEQLRSEQTRTGDIEHSLKSTVHTVQQELKEEVKSKLNLQGKLQEDSAYLVTLQEQSRREEEEMQRTAEDSQRQSQQQTDTAAQLEESLKEKQSHRESLQSQCEAVSSEHTATEESLQQRRDQLEPQEQELRAEVQNKVAKIDTISERMKLLEKRLEDVVKSSTMVGKMSKDTSAAIEDLESKLNALRQRMDEMKEEEESWRQEFKEISEFSADAKERHQTYLTERTELLQQHKGDLQSALAANTALASRHRELQDQFIETKTAALRVLERKLDLETSLRDHKQLLAFQSQMYRTMQSYYELRGASSRRELSALSHRSKLNLQQLKCLQCQFDTVLKLMQEFLQHGLENRDQEQRRHKRRTGPQTKDKSVTFNVPLTCES